jgi:hypothetical protein
MTNIVRWAIGVHNALNAGPETAGAVPATTIGIASAGEHRFIRNTTLTAGARSHATLSICGAGYAVLCTTTPRVLVERGSAHDSIVAQAVSRITTVVVAIACLTYGGATRTLSWLKGIGERAKAGAAIVPVNAAQASTLVKAVGGTTDLLIGRVPDAAAH